MEQAGYDIVAHVHDEVILEVPKGSTTVDAVCGIMNQNPYLLFPALRFRGNKYATNQNVYRLE